MLSKFNLKSSHSEISMSKSYTTLYLMTFSFETVYPRKIPFDFLTFSNNNGCMRREVVAGMGLGNTQRKFCKKLLYASKCAHTCIATRPQYI
jgi:hypothetical protein